MKTVTVTFSKLQLRSQITTRIHCKHVVIKLFRRNFK